MKEDWCEYSDLPSPSAYQKPHQEDYKLSMKVIISGGRDFNDYELLSSECNSILQNRNEIIIFSGGAKGADSFGEQYAKENLYELKVFPANWKKHGKNAGLIRNHEMANNADTLIAFWDGKSRGTKHMIDTATKKGLKVNVINYRSNNQGK